MDGQNKKNNYQSIISNLLVNRNIKEEDYNSILILLDDLNNFNNYYLIDILNLLQISSPFLDLKIQRFQLNSIINLLNNNNSVEELVKNEENLFPKIKENTLRENPPIEYTPLDELEAKSFQFVESENLKFPQEGKTSLIKEVFPFTDKDGIEKECCRKFRINSKGQTVEYLGEKIQNISDKQKAKEYYQGLLNKEYFDFNEE